MSEAAAWVLNATHWFSLLKQPMMIVIWCHDWEDASRFQYLMQILQVQFHDYVPRYQIFMFDDSKIYKLIQQWQEPTTVWDGQPVLGFMAESFLDDLRVIGFKHFNPTWTFPTTPVNQCWDPITFGMSPWHLNENTDKQKSKEALQSQSPIAAFKACNMIQALGIAYSKIVLPSGDSKAESRARTYCPTTWNYSYQWTYASQYADQLRREAKASALLCKECTLLVCIQLSNKSANHPNRAFADSMSTAMRGAMISLTPCIAPSVDRDCDLGEFVEFDSAADMIQKFSDILAKPEGFPPIPVPRKIAIRSMPSATSDSSSMSSAQSRIVNVLSTCQTRTPAWLKLLSLEIIHGGDSESMTSMAGIQSPTGPSRPPRMRGHGKKAAH